jgi:Ca-activated chloride channel homolog
MFCASSYPEDRSMTDTTLTLSAGLDRTLAWRRGGSARYVVAEVRAERAPDAGRVEPDPRPLNLALVIDASGSMAGSKLEHARRAALGVIQALGKRDRVSVVSFADDVITHVDGLTMTGPNKRRAAQAVAQLETRGRTNLGDGWLTGAECLARDVDGGSRCISRISRIILLSDGMANVGITSPEELAEHAAELRLRGITTSTVGIGDDYEAPVLQALAEHGGGQMHDAERAEEIVEVLLGELRDSLDLALENVTVTLSVPARVQAVPLGFYPTTTAAGEMRVVLGSLGGGRSRQAIFRLMLPAGEQGEEILLSLQAHAEAAGAPAPVAAPVQKLAVRLVRDRENNTQPRDVERSLAVARLWHASIVRTVARMNRAGDRREARHYLERELRFFQRYGKGLAGGDALTRELVLMLRRIGQEWNERTRKEMELFSFRYAYSAPDHRSMVRDSWVQRLKRAEPDAD